jgi:hypothetical protein
MDIAVNTNDIRGSVKVDGHNVLCRGTIRGHVANRKVSFAAAACADHRASFTGSGLPFANALHAFENTPNKGTVDVDHNGSFSFHCKMPNAYYIGLGSTYIPPTLYITWNNGEEQKDRSIVLNGIPFRKLTYPWQRTDASFYDKDLPIRSQEQILRDSAYPAIESTTNFWGLRPPV